MTPKTVKSNKMVPKAELPGMPEKDALGKAADAYRAASDAMHKAKEKVAEAAADLLVEMRKARRFIIPVDGGTLEAKDIAAKTEIKFIRAKGN